MIEYDKYLEKCRKRNGERFLPKTISIYSSFIDRYQTELENRNDDIESLITYMNTLIIQYWNPTLRASFKLYLLFIGVDEEDDRLLKLKKSKKRASAISSLRMLGEKVITREDLKFLYINVDDEWKLIIGFLYDTAVREAELLGMKWRDITFFEETEKIPAEVRVLGKGSKYRTVFLSSSTVKLLKKLRPNIESNDLIFVFRMNGGKLYSRQEKSLYDGIVKRTKNILGKKFSPHCLRHSKLTHLSENSCDILAISSIAGHSSISTTTIYAKMSKKVAETGYRNHSQSIEE